MREMNVTVYSFGELSDAAQERAINAFRYINVEFSWWEDTFCAIRTAGKLLGMEIDRIYFDADLYCIFDARYKYVRGADDLHKEFSWADDLCKVAKDLQDLQKRHFYSLSCNVASQRDTNSYRCFRFGKDYTCDDLVDILDDFAHWARVLLRDECEYLISDEAVNETIAINGYEFTEDGELA